MMNTNMNQINKEVSRSWFCMLANPENHGFAGTPQEIVDKIIEVWINNNPQRSCAVSYNISADGLKHCHAVFEDTKPMRFSAIRKLFPPMHIEPTKGNKQQAEDYINKRGKYAEKDEKVIYLGKHGEIKAHQGQRNDLFVIQELVDSGKTPNEILDMSISYRRHERIIRDAYYRKRHLETPRLREVRVKWHVGESGSGKSHTYVLITEEKGEDFVYLVAEYKNGFDKYNGEGTLFMDEFRGQGQLTYARLLNLLSGYRVQIQARYTNAVSLWNEVHITSVYPPEIVYKNMVGENNEIDSYEQLRRRINSIVYHFKKDGAYFQYEIPMSEYTDYEQLRNDALNSGKAVEVQFLDIVTAEAEAADKQPVDTSASASEVATDNTAAPTKDTTTESAETKTSDVETEAADKQAEDTVVSSSKAKNASVSKAKPKSAAVPKAAPKKRERKTKSKALEMNYTA